MSESGREGQSRPKKGKPSSTPTRKRTGALPITISILFIAAIAVTGFSQVWTDILWFNQLGFARVLWTQWIASALMALTTGLLTALAVWLSMRFAYRARPLHVPNPDDRGMEVYQKAIEPMRRTLTWLVPLGVGLFVGSLKPCRIGVKSCWLLTPQLLGLKTRSGAWMYPSISLFCRCCVR